MGLIDELVAEGCTIDLTFTQGNLKITAEDVDIEQCDMKKWESACFDVVAALRGWTRNDAPADAESAHVSIGESAALTKAKTELIEMHDDLHGD